MTLQLPRRPPVETTPGQDQVWWQQVCEAIEANDEGQDTLLAYLDAQVSALLNANLRLNIVTSFSIPTLILTATDAGSNATITIASHVRHYPDELELSLSGGALTGKSYSTTYAVYYDDPTRADLTPTYVATTDLEIAQANYASGRHYCGTVVTPAAAGGPTTGGAPPAGSGYTAGAGAVNIT